MKLTHRLPKITALALATLTGLGIAQVSLIPVLEKIPTGQLAGAIAGRFNLDSERNGQVNAYVTLMHGFPNALLFNGEASEKTARFTIVSTPLRLELLRIDTLIHARPAPVTGDAVRFRIFYDEFAANRDLTRPETLATGRLVAQFRARPWSFTAVPLLTAHAEGVLELESSEDFFVQGQRVNLRQLGDALRLQVHGGPVPAGRVTEPTLSFPIGGTGIAVDAFPPRAQ